MKQSCDICHCLIYVQWVKMREREREREREVVVCLADSGGIAEHLSFCN